MNKFQFKSFLEIEIKNWWEEWLHSFYTYFSVLSQMYRFLYNIFIYPISHVTTLTFLLYLFL
jgi:hypothetical protein